MFRMVGACSLSFDRRCTQFHTKKRPQKLMRKPLANLPLSIAEKTTSRISTTKTRTFNQSATQFPGKPQRFSVKRSTGQSTRDGIPKATEIRTRKITPSGISSLTLRNYRIEERTGAGDGI